MEPTDDRSNWGVGQLVARKGSDELGVVVDVDNHGVVKVKWDRGRTYHPHMPANVKLAESPVNKMEFKME
jgi:hypothetical protein